MARAKHMWLGILWRKDLVLPAPLDTTVWVKRVKVFQKGYLRLGIGKVLARGVVLARARVCWASGMVLAKESSEAN